MRVVIAALALGLLAGCTEPDTSNLTPDQRIAVLGIMMNRPQPQPYYGQAYQMQYQQPASFSCQRFGNMTNCQ